MKLFTTSVTFQWVISSSPRLQNSNRVGSIVVDVVTDIVETVAGVVTPRRDAVTDVVFESVSASSVDVGVVDDSWLLLLMVILLLIRLLL